MFGVILGRNATFEDGSVNLYGTFSENAEDLTPGKKGGKLCSLTVSKAAYEKGLCPGAAGQFEGQIEESTTKRADGTPWLRLRVSKIQLARLGNRPVVEADIAWPE